jgi:hypothetical protein
VLRTGAIVPVSAEGRLVVFRRELPGERVLVALNADKKKAASVPLGSGGPYVDAFSNEPLPPAATIPPLGALVAIERPR